jgi:hypothetical protein
LVNSLRMSLIKLLISGNKGLCSKNIEEVRGEDQWTSKLCSQGSLLVMFYCKYLCSWFQCDGFQVLRHLLYLMRVGEKSVQRRVALALAHFCAPEDQRTIFIDNNGINSLA